MKIRKSPGQVGSADPRAIQPDPPNDQIPGKGSDSDEEWYPVKQAIKEGRDHRHASRSRLMTQKIRRPKKKARS